MHVCADVRWVVHVCADVRWVMHVCADVRWVACMRLCSLSRAIVHRCWLCRICVRRCYLCRTCVRSYSLSRACLPLMFVHSRMCAQMFLVSCICALMFVESLVFVESRMCALMFVLSCMQAFMFVLYQYIAFISTINSSPLRLSLLVILTELQTTFILNGKCSKSCMQESAVYGCFLNNSSVYDVFFLQFHQAKSLSDKRMYSDVLLGIAFIWQCLIQHFVLWYSWSSYEYIKVHSDCQSPCRSYPLPLGKLISLGDDAA